MESKASGRSARRGGHFVRPLNDLRLPHLADYLGQGLPFHKLHRVVMHAPLAPDRVDLNDVGVLQRGGGQGFIVEPLQLAGIENGSKREGLQRHPATQRDLLGFVDDAHSAATNLPADAEIAERPRGGVRADPSLRGAENRKAAILAPLPRIVQPTTRAMAAGPAIAGHIPGGPWQTPRCPAVRRPGVSPSPGR